jgi:2-polyprenyl-6-methoxyphenol hydroxylase-like FAD-dependent oxidoreductase
MHNSPPEEPDVLIVGGGPAGMMAALLLARGGVRVLVLEKHGDFLRDFRGDTVHPSTMEVLSQIGLLEKFLARPHDRVELVEGRIAGRDYHIGSFRGLDTPARFIAMMPQWEFLDFLRDEAEAHPSFGLRMDAGVSALLQDQGRIAGVRLTDGREIHPRLLTIMADGRGSLVRREGVLPVTQLGAPMDVLWFRLPKAPHNGEALRGAFSTGRVIVLIDRRDYWQAAFLIAKGTADEVRARGVDWIRAECQRVFPELDLGGQGGLHNLDDLFLLSVALDRLDTWHRPGLLAIGDAAHAMSPIGGIGINLAIQDAVATANLLGPRLSSGELVDDILEKVEQRRLLPTRLIQRGQKLAQDNVIGAALSGREITGAPWPVRLLNRFPRLRRIPGRIIGLGIRRERVTWPPAPAN